MCNLNCRRQNFEERASVEKCPRTRTRNKKGKYSHKHTDIKADISFWIAFVICWSLAEFQLKQWSPLYSAISQNL